ncbi:hypothetical protein KQX54_016137 [Cotesia glomerata]|uniref:Uncharacterized protein n=1 Tax=Cotesia glomerata TaxID=32391 RepID=A0AAV7HRW8_COTGL|nr:hypothetical protein KQX54_016137 [Cotesia glomerata]
MPSQKTRLETRHIAKKNNKEDNKERMIVEVKDQEDEEVDKEPQKRPQEFLPSASPLSERGYTTFKDAKIPNPTVSTTGST